MMGRGGRDRFRGEFPPKSEEKGNSARRNAPPSRHLWVGNLSAHVTEVALSEQFLRFGEIESLAFVPGRSYAFINFKSDEDGIIAMRALQGSVVAGLPMKIEFTKGEKSLPSSHGDNHVQNRASTLGSAECGDAFGQRDRRSHLGSPEKFSDKLKDDTNVEPSEVLWIGFPSFLNVDEMILRKAFSPFGEIEKITTFSGRSYAFVRFRSIVAACRAKEALQGKLFNNPRVNITFAKNEQGSSEYGRSSISTPLSSVYVKSNDPTGLDSSARFVSDFDKSRNFGAFGINRNTSMHVSHSDIIERNEQGFLEDFNEHFMNSPVDRGRARHEFILERPTRRPKVFDEHLSDESFSLPDAKKLKTSPFPDKELPEYPFTVLEQEEHHGGSRLFSDRIESKQFDHGRVSVNPKVDEPWKTNDRFEVGLSPLPPRNAVGQKFTSETHGPPPTELWKWEGTIAKGGTPVCRACCFPVGKVLDIMLPEFLNCTARTALDMLAKHFYQAASYWVVFFVPESDSDIAYYNEFMHYLGEKQRAAVAKLSEKTTLFLVPPSDFSERVLKVPGKMSISGVILRFQHPDSNFVPLHQSIETMDSKPSSFPDLSFRKSSSPDISASSWGQDYNSISLGRVHSSTTSIPVLNKLGSRNPPYREKISTPHHDSRFGQLQHQNPSLPTNCSPNENRNSYSSGIQVSGPTSRAFDDSFGKENMSSKPRVLPETVSSPYIPGTSGVTLPGTKFSQFERNSRTSSAVRAPSLPPDQLAQLASLLENQQQGKFPILPSGEDHNQSNLRNQLELATKSGTKALNLTYNHSPASDPWASQHGQGHQLQPSRTEIQDGISDPQGNQNNDRVETEARLQATLQLAAALLQQIQQQGKTGDQQQ